MALRKRRRQRRVNPYFRPKNVGGSRTLVVRALFGILAVALVASFFYSPLFHVQTVRVEGASDDLLGAITTDAQAWLGKRTALVLPRRHRLLLRTATLEQKLIEAFPLNLVTVTRDKRELVVRVNEKIRTFYLLKEDTLYAVDRFGMVLEQVDDLERARIMLELESGARVPVIADQRGGGVTAGQPIIAPAWLENIVALFDAIESRTMLSPRAATIIDEEGRVDVETDAGVMLYVNIEKQIDTQVDKLSALIDRRLVDITELTYIDLRFTNRLFYH